MKNTCKNTEHRELAGSSGGTREQNFSSPFMLALVENILCKEMQI
jgi:hypothetical protein